MGKREQKSIETTNKILLSAKYTLASKGYSKTTIAAVAEKAGGVSRGLLHYHFKNKEEMLARVLSSNINEISTSLEATASDIDTVEEFIEIFISSIKDLMTEDSACSPSSWKGLRHQGIVSSYVMSCTENTSPFILR